MNINIMTVKARLPISGNDYYIVNAHSGKILAVEFGGSANGTRVLQYDNQTHPWQTWRITRYADGTAVFSPTHALHMFLDVLDGSSGLVNGGRVGLHSGQSDGRPWAESVWNISESATGSGSFRITSNLNHNTTKALTVQNAHIHAGALVFLYDFVNHGPANDEWYFVSANTNRRIVSVAVQRTASFRQHYGHNNQQQSYAIMGAAQKPFYHRFGIEFRNWHYDINNMSPASSCSNYPNRLCNHAPESQCSMLHHTNGVRNTVGLSNILRPGYNIRSGLTSGLYCTPHSDLPNTHRELRGAVLAPAGVGYTTFRHDRPFIAHIRVLQHEISHIFGVPDALRGQPCLQPCVMGGGLDNNARMNLPTVWCDFHESFFNVNRF